MKQSSCKLCGATFICDNGQWSTTCACAKDRADELKEVTLVDWFKTTFAARTPPQSVLDSTPEYRVGWHEISAKMRELGYTDGVLDLRYEWDHIFRKYKLRSFCNVKLKEAGERSLNRQTLPAPTDRRI